MCLDPRPDRLFRATRSVRRRTLLHAPESIGLHASSSHTSAGAVISTPVLWALDTLAGDDDLLARGWVVLSREA